MREADFHCRNISVLIRHAVKGVGESVMGGCLPIGVLLGITRITDNATHGSQLGQSTFRFELRSDGRGQHGSLLLGAVDVYELTGMQISGSGEWPRGVMNAQQSAPCLYLARERIRRRVGGLGRASGA